MDEQLEGITGKPKPETRTCMKLRRVHNLVHGHNLIHGHIAGPMSAK